MFNRCRPTLVFGFTLGVGLSHGASAQVAQRWSADAGVGAAAVNGGGFFNTGRAAARLSVADRMLQRGRFAMYAEAGYEWLGEFGLLGGNADLVCVVDRAGGGCRPPYPYVTGPSASIGMAYRPFARAETRVGVGGAGYSVDGTRVGAAVGQLDAAVFPAAHLGLILGARLAVIPQYRHERLSMVPVLVGVRVQ